MNKFNLEINYKDICSVTCNITPSGNELVVELLDGSIIKAYQYEKSSFGIPDILDFQGRSSNERYEALNKVVTDYMTYARAINDCHGKFHETLKEVEAELEKE